MHGYVGRDEGVTGEPVAQTLTFLNHRSSQLDMNILVGPISYAIFIC